VKIKTDLRTQILRDLSHLEGVGYQYTVYGDLSQCYTEDIMLAITLKRTTGFTGNTYIDTTPLLCLCYMKKGDGYVVESELHSKYGPGTGFATNPHVIGVACWDQSGFRSHGRLCGGENIAMYSNSIFGVKDCIDMAYLTASSVADGYYSTPSGEQCAVCGEPLCIQKNREAWEACEICLSCVAKYAAPDMYLSPWISSFEFVYSLESSVVVCEGKRYVVPFVTSFSNDIYSRRPGSMMSNTISRVFGPDHYDGDYDRDEEDDEEEEYDDQEDTDAEEESDDNDDWI
jgi:hypothetical protein